MRLLQDQAAAAAPAADVYDRPAGRLARRGSAGTRTRTAEERRDQEHAASALDLRDAALGEVGLRLELAPGLVRVRAEGEGGAASLAEDAPRSSARGWPPPPAAPSR